ncbi:hypothetical protein FQR65_LT00365 [Abscondita terminalis]|nr:hypothetical protein FQR65_LT00365 [Abscondita terminalis]
MAFVATLMEELRPPHWTVESYANRRFVKIQLSQDSNEYQQILSEFRANFQLNVIRISRIQHPFAFCRFKLRQRQLYHRTGRMPETIMALLSELMDELKPPNWTEESYVNRRFVKVQLTPDSDEYQEILSEFKAIYDELRVISIIRIQHPFAFCRFKLRQRHIYHSTGSMPGELRKFFRLNTVYSKVDQIIEYNCDPRRDSSFYYGDTYQFADGNYVVVTKQLSGYKFNERDSHHFPEYLIECDLRPTKNNQVMEELDNDFKNFQLL